MASANPWADGEREVCVDRDAVHRYWARNIRKLPNFELFQESELRAAVALGIEAVVRNSRPSLIQSQLKQCFDRLAGGSLLGWETVLQIAEHVYEQAQTQAKASNGHMEANPWPWVSLRPSMRQLPRP
jgi:hypothetical protein